MCQAIRVWREILTNLLEGIESLINQGKPLHLTPGQFTQLIWNQLPAVISV